LKRLVITNDQLVLEEHESPVVKTGEVRLRVLASSISPFDIFWEMRGLEIVGEVIELGPAVNSLERGMRVVVGGRAVYGWQEEVVVEARWCYPVPKQVSNESAVWLGYTFATARQALMFDAHLTEGENLLVFPGHSPLGLAALQQGMALGARVIAVTSSAGSHSVRIVGADLMLDLAKIDQWPQQVAAVGGVDVAVLSGLDVPQNVLDNLFSMMNREGRLVVCSPTAFDQTSSIPLGRLLSSHLRIIGSPPVSISFGDHWELATHLRHQQFRIPGERYPLDPKWVTSAVRKVRNTGVPALVDPTLEMEPLEEFISWTDAVGRNRSPGLRTTAELVLDGARQDQFGGETVREVRVITEPDEGDVVAAVRIRFESLVIERLEASIENDLEREVSARFEQIIAERLSNLISSQLEDEMANRKGSDLIADQLIEEQPTMATQVEEPEIVESAPRHGEGRVSQESRKVRPGGTIVFQKKNYQTGVEAGETVELEIRGDMIRILYEGHVVKVIGGDVSDADVSNTDVEAIPAEVITTQPSRKGTGEKRKVQKSGVISFKGKKLKVGKEYAGEQVVVYLTDDGVEIETADGAVIQSGT